MKRITYPPSEFIKVYRDDIDEILTFLENYCYDQGWTIINQQKLFKSLFQYIYKYSDKTIPSYDR